MYVSIKAYSANGVLLAQAGAQEEVLALAAELEEQALLAASAEERADAAEAEAAHLRARLEDAQVRNPEP